MDADDADDLLEMVELELRRRRMAKVVRLELPAGMSQTMRDFIVTGLEVSPQEVYTCDGPIDMDDLFALANLELAHLKFKRVGVAGSHAIFRRGCRFLRGDPVRRRAGASSLRIFRGNRGAVYHPGHAGLARAGDQDDAVSHQQ